MPRHGKCSDEQTVDDFIVVYTTALDGTNSPQDCSQVLIMAG
jgi:hypothetical protein